MIGTEILYLDDEFDADLCRARHHFCRIRQQNNELWNDYLCKMRKSSTQHCSKVAYGDARFTSNLGPQVFQLGEREREG